MSLLCCLSHSDLVIAFKHSLSFKLYSFISFYCFRLILLLTCKLTAITFMILLIESKILFSFGTQSFASLHVNFSSRFQHLSMRFILAFTCWPTQSVSIFHVPQWIFNHAHNLCYHLCTCPQATIFFCYLFVIEIQCYFRSTWCSISLIFMFYFQIQ